MIAAHRGAYMFSLMKNPEAVEQNVREWEAARKEMDGLLAEMRPVSYTHLDVYKRQASKKCRAHQ